MEFNANSDSSQLALAAYRHTPCSYCRSHAVDRLVERNIAPAWLLEECRDDANDICRKAAEPETDDESTATEGEMPA